MLFSSHLVLKVAASLYRATPAAPPPSSRGQAIIAGAGPAGCVAAMFLMRQGFAVKVLEKRGDPTAPEAEEANKSTFIMALMPRGINPLKDVSALAAQRQTPERREHEGASSWSAAPIE